MNWATLQDGLKAWFAAGSGLQVFWMNDQGPMNDRPYGTLQIISTRTIAEDEMNYEFSTIPDPDGLIPIVSGYRLMTVTCQIITRNQSGNNIALTYLEKARTSLRLPRLRSALATAGLAVVETHPTVMLDGVFDKRWESRASFDVVFGMVQNIAYTDEAGEDWIEQTEISSDLEPTDDSSSLELDEELFGILD